MSIDFTTPLPPQPPSDGPPPTPPPPPARPGRVGTLVAWVVIACFVAITMTRGKWVPLVRPARAATQPAQQAIADVRSPQLLLVSRYAVGASAIAGDAAQSSSRFVDMVEQQAAGSPVDEFRAIPVIGELRGNAAALERLDRFEQEHTVVRLRGDVDALRVIYTDGVGRLSDARAADLVARHGWFGQLAVSHGLPPSDPRRAAALQPAGRAVLVGLMSTFGGGAMLVAGVVLCVLAGILYFKGLLPRAYRPPGDGAHAGAFAEAFALYLATFVLLGVALALLFPRAHFWPNWAASVVVPLAVLWLRFRGAPWAEIRQGLGWHAGRGFFREVGAGLAGYVTGLPLIALGLLVTVILIKTSGLQPTHPIGDMPTDTLADALQIFVLAAAWAPVIEETMFRGALFHHLRARFGWWISTIVVSLIFAAIHPQGWTTIPVLACIAVVLAGIREWRGSIVGPMAAHALHNGVLMTLFLTTMR